MLYDKRWEVPKVDEKRELQEWQKILLKAAALLRRRGWCRREFQNDSGSLCAYGAINVAAGLEAHNEKFQATPLIEAIHHLERTIGDVIFHWNDHHAKSRAEVISALKKAAAAERPVADYQAWHLWLC